MTDADTRTGGFVPPPYPYDRLNDLVAVADAHAGGAVDLSIGTPIDPTPASVEAALATPGAATGYPASIGTAALREAAAAWIARRFDVAVDPGLVGACVGTKEFVSTLPQLLRLRTPARDTVLYPEIAYPSYAMGAVLGGCRAVPVPLDAAGRLRLDTIDPHDVERALVLWTNSPGNPTGACDDLGAVAAWGRGQRVPVFSDECYVEFTWEGRGATILEHDVEGVVAVHSLSKRSNFAGARCGFYAGDPELVGYLQEVRKHLGMMVPGPTQVAAAAALADDEHVVEQRDRYLRRLRRLAAVFGDWSGQPVPLPAGGFYLWIDATPRWADGWAMAAELAAAGGAVVSPGEFYGDAAASFVRVAVVQPDDRVELVADRLLRGGAAR